MISPLTPKHLCPFRLVGVRLWDFLLCAGLLVPHRSPLHAALANNPLCSSGSVLSSVSLYVLPVIRRIWEAEGKIRHFGGRPRGLSARTRAMLISRAANWLHHLKFINPPGAEVFSDNKRIRAITCGMRHMPGAVNGGVNIQEDATSSWRLYP